MADSTFRELVGAEMAKSIGDATVGKHMLLLLNEDALRGLAYQARAAIEGFVAALESERPTTNEVTLTKKERAKLISLLKDK